MKTFRQYNKDKKIGSGVIPEPIHFRNASSLNEGSYDSWKNKNDNTQFSRRSSITSQLKPIAVSKVESTAIGKYTANSKPINKKLISSVDLTDNDKKTVGHLDSVIDKNKISHNIHTYAGIGFDPTKHTDKNGRMKSPSYISVTHDKDVAHSFTSKHNDGIHHIMHLELKAGDPAAHIAEHSHRSHEGETLIKRDVTLQHHGHEDYEEDGKKYRIHRMSIAKD